MKLQISLSFKTACMALAAFSLLSCECTRTADGVVLDEKSLLPIDSVLVKGVVNVYNQEYTDSTGRYFMTTGMTGAVGGCPDIKISFSKEGYQSLTLTNPDDDNVYMKKK